MSLLGRLVVTALVAIMIAFLAAVARVKGLFSAELAAWVQGFGTIAAVAVAAALPHFERKNVVAEAEASVALLAEATAKSARHLLRCALDDEYLAWENHPVVLNFGVLREALAAFPLDRLRSQELIRSFLELRAMATAMEAGGMRMTDAMMASRIDQAAADLRGLEQMVPAVEAKAATIRAIATRRRTF